MSRRCPRCGLDEDGRGIMCADPESQPPTLTQALWVLVAVGLVIAAIALLPH